MNKEDMLPETKDWKTYDAGQDIFREGDRGDELYVIVDGAVDIIAHGQHLETIEGAGGVFGELAIIDAGPRSATARARTECTLVSLTREGFLFHIQKTPDFALQVMRVMSERMRKLLQAGSGPSG